MPTPRSLGAPITKTLPEIAAVVPNAMLTWLVAPLR
jgi:hypothetical protein